MQEKSPEASCGITEGRCAAGRWSHRVPVCTRYSHLLSSGKEPPAALSGNDKLIAMQVQRDRIGHFLPLLQFGFLMGFRSFPDTVILTYFGCCFGFF